MFYLSAPASQAGARLPLKGDIMTKAIGYVICQSGGYPDDRNSYKPCATRALVEAELVDYGWLENPGLYVYKLAAGQSAESVIDQLIESRDPYPDYIVERGPRGGIRWERA